jgi:protein TonB
VAAPPPPPAPVRVGGDIKAPTKIKDVQPQYPAIARAAKVQGRVILEATIAKDGSVKDVKILRPLPMLDQAAVEAVQQWKYTPTMLNKEPVEVIMTVTVDFALQ